MGALSTKIDGVDFDEANLKAHSNTKAHQGERPI
jgi:hypothetical protein